MCTCIFYALVFASCQYKCVSFFRTLLTFRYQKRDKLLTRSLKALLVCKCTIQRSPSRQYHRAKGILLAVWIPQTLALKGYYLGALLFNSRLSFSASYCSAPKFLQFKEFELFWGAVFLRLEEDYWRSPF